MPGLLKRLLSISPEEASFTRRKFHFVSDSTRRHLERVGETFLEGYHLALCDRGSDSIAAELQKVDPEFRGFGFEGAAMGLDILDQLKPWKACRIDDLLRKAGRPHMYMVHVGVGWSMARWRAGITRRLSRLDPLLRWLALDGFGFHEGYFNWAHYVSGGSASRIIDGYGKRVFDQGLGRSLWFVAGADPDYIVSIIQRFHGTRRNDLWSGVGLACTYAGGAERGAVEALRLAVGPSWAHLAQGAAFAAAARHRAGNVNAKAELNCRLLSGLSVQAAAEICDRASQNLESDNGTPAYEIWRCLIRERLMASQCSEPVLRPHQFCAGRASTQDRRLVCTGETRPSPLNQ